jgi:hypothetical protein
MEGAQEATVRALISKDVAGDPSRELSNETRSRRDGQGLDHWLAAERTLTRHYR